MFFTTWRDLQGCAASSTCIQNRKAPERILDTVMWGLKSSKLKIMKFMFQIWRICRMVMPVIKILPKSIVAAGGKKLHFGYIGLGLRLATRICQRDSTCFWTKKNIYCKILVQQIAHLSINHQKCLQKRHKYFWVLSITSSEVRQKNCVP